MTQRELRQVAEESWEGCDGCTPTDRGFWIDGFMRAANLFADVNGLPSPDQLEEEGKLKAEVFTRLASNQRVISDNLNDLI